MKSKTAEKGSIPLRGISKNSLVKKSKDIVKPVVSQKTKARNSIATLRSQDLLELKTKSQSPKKHVVKPTAPKCGRPAGSGANAAKPSGTQLKEKAKKLEGLKRSVGTKKDISKEGMKKKKVTLKTKVKGKQQCEAKAKMKKKVSNQRDISHFIDLWSLASIGKREASLNATMKVNIMYERQSSPKKSVSTESSPVKSPASNKSPTDSKKCVKENTNNKASISSPVKKAVGRPSKDASESTKNMKNATGCNSKKSTDKKSEPSNKKSTEDRKRKAQYKIYEDEPVKKGRKKESEKNQKVKPKKTPKKKGKTSVLGFSIGNIIEKSPRQASLNAKAMIAMEQEDEIPMESAARARIYDWTEVRSCVVSDARKMTWVTGNGDMKGLAQLQKNRDTSVKNTSASAMNLVNADDIVKDDSCSLHNALLKTIHQMGDARLLKEFFRSQKEDFQGEVDIERCPTPEPPSPVKEKEPATPSPKKKSTPHSASIKKPEKQIIKPLVSSPAKPMPCRVATPIPQFPSGQRPSHMTSFIHHPSTPSVYANLDQHQKQPQPIKVTPYAPSSAYVYQYSPERQQQNIFVPNTPSPMPFGADANDLVQRNFPGTFTFNQMGGLSFDRRGLNPYQHPPNSAYNPSMHMPIQPIGFNFQQFYQPTLQQLHSQQNLPSIQQVPLAHQQYPLVPPPSVMQQSHSLGSNLNPIRAYQSTYPQYPAPSTGVAKQDKPCMPPPSSCPGTQSLSQESPMTSIVQPLPSYRKAVPINPQVQSHRLLKPSPERLCANNNAANSSSPSAASHNSYNPQIRPLQLFNKGGSNNIVIHNPQPIRLPSGINAAFRPIICKKEKEMMQQLCDKVEGPLNLESPKKAAGNVKTAVNESSMSDILHSAHSTMFPVEEKSASSEYSPANSKQNKIVAPSSSSPSKVPQMTNVVTASSKSGDNFNGSYSVSSILEMPNFKVKPEPKTKSCAINTNQNGPIDQKNKVARKETYYLCIPPPKVSVKPGTSLLTTTAIPLTDNFPLKLPEKKKAVELNIKQFPNDNKVIVIDDSSDSSDDEPLAKLVQPKPVEISSNKPKNIGNPVPKIKTLKPAPTALKIKLFEKKSKVQSTKPKQTKTKLNAEGCGQDKTAGKIFTQLKTKQPKPKKTHDVVTGKVPASAKQTTKKDKDVVKETTKTCPDSVALNNDSNNSNSLVLPAKKPGPKLIKKAPVRRKSKCKTLIPPSLPEVKAVHAWSWVGDGEWKMIPKLTMQREESLRVRKCYKSMKHALGEVISVKDCVILQSEVDGAVPYVGKVSALWENLNGDMMFSMLWYYQPEHTLTGREPEDGEQELFASKHREENSVACIDDKCYVVMYNEFCRMEADAIRHELGLSTPSSHQMIPPLTQEDRNFLRPLPPQDICMENIWFCRYDYDIRKKFVRKPKHKKTDLRYRGPCKLVQ